MTRSIESLELEVAIARNGSLESATRRATLFGRLIDENKQNTFHPRYADTT